VTVCFVPSAVSQYEYVLQFSGSTVGSEAHRGRDVHSLKWSNKWLVCTHSVTEMHWCIIYKCDQKFQNICKNSRPVQCAGLFS